MRLGYSTLVLALASSLAAVGEGQAQTRPAAEPSRQLARDLHADLADLRQRAETLRASLVAGHSPSPADVAAVTSAIDRVRADQLLLPRIEQDTQDRLQRAGGAVALERQKATAAERQRKLDALARSFDAFMAASDPIDVVKLRAAIDLVIAGLTDAVAPANREPLSAVLSGVPLPFRSVTLGLPPQEPATAPTVVPAYLGGGSTAATSDDLAAGPDVKLDAAIRTQASALHHNPIEIFEFVLNNIDIELYQGSMKGATETLRERSGNDVDHVSLLVALMRASGFPARYIRGVVELSATQAMSWTGVTSTARVTDALTRAGIPFRVVRRAGAVAGFQIEHTWAEVLVSYSNYRGAPLDRLGRSWVPLDPSIKTYAFKPGLESLRSLGFSADQLLPAYLAGPQSISPLDFFNQQLADYLAANRAGVSFQEANARWTRQESKPQLLPSTLPYLTTAITQETSRLSDAVRHHLRVVARGENGVSFDVTLATSDVLGQRLTLSYVPATVDDQIAVNAFLELDNTPAYLVKLRPVLKVAGVVRAAGEAPVQMGAVHDVTIEIRTPRITLPVTNTIVAGGYYAIGVSSPRTTWQPPSTPTPQDTERAAADVLFGLAAEYAHRWNEAERTLAAILGVVPVRPALSEVMVGNVYHRTLLFGQPEAIEWRGVFVDADLRVTEAVPASLDDALAVEFMRLSGLIGSMLESDVLEDTLGADSVSAAKLIQLARAGGIPLEEISRANVATVLPALQTDDIVKTHIADAVNQGFAVTVPRADFSRHAWRGIGYIARDAATGASGYFISGGLAGGMSALAPEDWVQQQYVDMLGHPYADPPNTDPTAAHSITKVTSTDLQTKEVTKTVPLSVWIRDDEGRPVKNAIVTFTVRNFALLKNGNFGGAPTTIAQTNDLGIATATLTLGTSTGESPFYVMANSTDKHVSQAGETTVTAKVDGAGGPIELADPFQAFALPGPADHLKKVLGDGRVVTAATALGTLRVFAQDQFDNPVANLPIDFIVDNPPAFPAGAVAPAGYRNLVIYPRDPPCAIQTPILGDCDAQPQVLGIVSSISGAAVDAIAGDTVETTYTVRARSTGLPDALFTLKTGGHRTYGSRKYIPPSLSIKRLELVNNNDAGVLNAAKVGTLFERPLGAGLYVIEDNYELQPTGLPCPHPTDPCFSVVSTETARIRPVDIKMSGPDITFPAVPDPVTVPKAAESAAVKFSVLQGGGTPAVRIISTPGQTLPERPLAANPGQGQYYSWLTVGAAPALNRVQIDAVAEVWAPCFDLHNGIVIPKLLTLAPGQQLLNPTSCTSEPPLITPTTPPPLEHEVFGVKARVEETTVRVVKPTGTNTYLADADLQLPYAIEPADYRSDRATVNLFEIDPQTGNERWIGVLPGTQLQGTGSVRVNRGTSLDPQRAHQAELVLNAGSEAQVKSDRARLLVYADALLTASSTPISTRLDRINGTVCSTPGSLTVAVGLDAVVTIKVDGVVLTTPTLPPVTYNNYPATAGPTVIQISNTMAPGVGDHPFEITAVVTLPGGGSQTLTVTGAIHHDVIINASLPVGHTFIKGVDLLDGHFTLTRDDLSIAGLGPGLQFVRVYSSGGSSASGPMGAGWSHNYMARMVVDSCDAITLIGGEGSGVRFSNPVPDTDPSGNPVLRYKPQAGYHGTLLQQQDGSYDYFTKERIRYHYEVDPAAADQARLAYIEDTHGQKLTLTYATGDPFMLKWVTDASNRRLTFHYQDFGFPSEPRIVRVEGPLDLHLAFGYDQYGNLKTASRTESSGGPSAPATRTESYFYSDTNPEDRFNLVRFTDANGNDTAIGYYGATEPFLGAPTGRYACANASVCPEKYEFVKNITPGFGTPDASTYGFTYDYSNQSVKVVTTIVDPHKVSTVYTLNPFGNVNETRILAAGGDIVTETRWAFDDGIDDVYVTSSTDANGRITTFSYDLRGNLTDEIVDLTTGAPYGDVKDRHGNVVSSVTAHTDYHPVFNKPTRRIDAEGRVTLYTIDPANGDVLLETRDPDDGTPLITTEYTYHANGRLKTMKDPRGHISQYSYDQFGNVKAVTSPGATSTSQYDERSRLLNSGDSLGHLTEYDYDALDRVTKITKRAGVQPTDASMRSADQVTAFGYLPGGEKEFVTNGLGLTTRYTYDGQNRVKTETDDSVEDADGSTRNLVATYTYDAVGNRKTAQNRRLINRRFTYDDLNRLTLTEVADGSGWRTESFASFDAVGNRLTEYDLHGAQHTVTYSYDRLYRQVSTNLPLAPPRTRTKAFDRVGTLLSESDANGNATTFAYDGVYRLRTRTDARGNTTTYKYDSAGNRLEETSSNGLVIRYTGYDALNRPASIIREFNDPLTGIKISYPTDLVYDDVRHTRDTRNGRGIVIREQLNGLDLTVERTADVGGLNLVTTFKFDGAGNLAARKDSENGDVDEKSTYDGLSRRIKREIPLGGKERFYYDGSGNLVRYVDRAGISSRYEYDVFERRSAQFLTESLSNGGAELTRAVVHYDDAAVVVHTTDARGYTTEHHLDALHREVKTIDSLKRVLRTEWNGVNKTAEVDKRGARREFDYDELNRLTTARELDLNGVLASTTTMDFDDAHNRQVETDRRGGRRISQFDALGRLRRTSRAHPSLQAAYGSEEVVLEEREYDANDNIVASVDANGNRTANDYDAADRLVVVRHGLPTATTTRTYDGAGNVTSIKDARAHGGTFDWRYTHDARYRRVSEENGAGGLTTFTYDQNNNLKSKTDPKRAGHVTFFAYDELNALVSVDETRGGAGGITRYQYDANRNVIALQDASGTLTTFSYDPLDRVSDRWQHRAAGMLAAGMSRTQNSGGDPKTALHWHFEYDGNGNETLIVDGEGQRVAKSYDHLNRLTRKEYANHKVASGGAVFPKLVSTAFDYDPSGNLVRSEEEKLVDAQTTSTEVTTEAFDHLDRLTEVVNADNKTVRYTYDRQGNRRIVTDPQGTTTTYTYDALNRVETASVAGTAGAMRYEYWPDNLVKKLTYPNGAVTEMTYDAADRLLTVTNLDGRPASPPLSRYEYAYDAHGNRTRQIEQHRNLAGGVAEETTYGFDALDRLISVRYPGGAAVQYTYAPNGNRVSESGTHPVTRATVARRYTYNGLNELITIEDSGNPAQSVVFAYDGNGNTLSQTIGALTPGAPPVGRTTFAYDIRDQLVAADTGSTATAFDYDYRGRRVKAKGPVSHIRYLYDEKAVLQEYDGHSLAPTLGYRYGAGLFSLVTFGATPGDRAHSFYHFDGLQSVSALTGESGQLQASYQYDAWGGMRASANATPNRRTFAGEYVDPETGLHYFGARYYDDKVGRFLTQDPFAGDLTVPPSLHRYAYSYNNPTTFTDRDGRLPTAVTGAIGLGVGAIGGCIVGAIKAEAGQGWAGCGKGAAVGAVVGGLAGLTLGGSLALTAKVGMGTFVASGTLAGGAGIVGTYTGATVFSVGAAGLVGSALGEVLGVAARDSKDVGDLAANLVNPKFIRDHADEMDARGRMGAFIGFTSGTVAGWAAESLTSSGVSSLASDFVSTVVGDLTAQGLGVTTGTQDSFDPVQLALAGGLAPLGTALSSGADAVISARKPTPAAIPEPALNVFRRVSAPDLDHAVLVGKGQAPVYQVNENGQVFAAKVMRQSVDSASLQRTLNGYQMFNELSKVYPEFNRSYGHTPLPGGKTAIKLEFIEGFRDAGGNAGPRPASADFNGSIHGEIDPAVHPAHQARANELDQVIRQVTGDRYKSGQTGFDYQWGLDANGRLRVIDPPMIPANEWYDVQLRVWRLINSMRPRK